MWFKYDLCASSSFYINNNCWKITCWIPRMHQADYWRFICNGRGKYPCLKEHRAAACCAKSESVTLKFKPVLLAQFCVCSVSQNSSLCSLPVRGSRWKVGWCIQRSWMQRLRGSTATPGLFDYALNAARCIFAIISRRINVGARRRRRRLPGAAGRTGVIWNVQEFILKSYPSFQWCWSWSFHIWLWLFRSPFTRFILPGPQFSYYLVFMSPDSRTHHQLGMRVCSGINVHPPPTSLELLAVLTHGGRN